MWPLKNKKYKHMKLKIYLIVLMAHVCVLQYGCTQNKNRDSQNEKHISVFDVQAEKDWKHLDSIKSLLCDYPKECELYDQSSFIEKERFKDAVSKNKSQLAEAFLDAYPNDTHYYEVLKFFLNLNFEPRFVAKNIPDSIMGLLSQVNKKGERSKFLHQNRVLPIDKETKDKWLKKGNELVSKYLKSNASLERKAKIEIGIIGRDFRIALFQYQIMNIPRKEVEADYWDRFDAYYWESFRLRTYELLEKYSNLESMGLFVQQMVALMAKFSPRLTESNWIYFLNKTNSNNKLANHKGFKKVQAIAKESLRTLKIKEENPLEMEFTAIDGTKINLDKMRGQVILIDFWTISCAPCIKEMPHIMAMYDKYRNLGFSVIGIVGNSDAALNRIIEITEKANATWPQYLDKGKDAKISYHALFNIKSFPTVWLLDKNGIVVDKNARGDRLEPLIRNYLGLEK